MRPWTLPLLLLFAGCVGTDAGQGLAADTQAAGSGGIRGVLYSEELFPVVGALVEIPGVAATESNETGRFVFEGLAPGDVMVNVSAAGYEPTQQEVAVPEEGYAEVRFELVGIPGEAPYLTTLIHNGFLACSFSAVYSAGWLLPVCPAGESENAFTTEVTSDWRAGVHELDWESPEEMQLASTLDGPLCRGSPPPMSKCAALVGGPAPLRVTARPEDAEYAAQHSIDGKTMWPTGNYTSTLVTYYSGLGRTEINATFNPVCQEINAAGGVPRSLGCPFGVGVSTGLRFTFYHTTFYLQEPEDLAGFSARPDA